MHATGAQTATEVALASCRTLSHLWVPRFTDNNFEGIVPTTTPVLLSSLPDDDAMSEDEDEDENEAPPKKITMADVHSLFKIPPKPKRGA